MDAMALVRKYGKPDDMTTTTTSTTPPNASTTSSNMTTSPTKMTTSSIQASSTTSAQVFDGPITHSRATKLQQEVHTLLCEFHFNINENYILHKSCMLLLLRFTKEDDKDTLRMN
jgi:hypothetical protein